MPYKSKHLLKIWTKAEEDYLRLNYTTASMADMETFCKTTPQKIRAKAGHLGITGERKKVIDAAFKARPKVKRYQPKVKELRPGYSSYKIDGKTTIYIKNSASKKERDCIISKYLNPAKK